MAAIDPPIYISEREIIIIVVVIMMLFLTATIFMMIKDYRLYLENHWKKQYSFADFIKREQFYVYILLLFIFMIGGELLMRHLYYRN